MLGLNLGAASSSGGVANYDFGNALLLDATLPASSGGTVTAGGDNHLTSNLLTATGDFTLSFWLNPQMATGNSQRFWLIESSNAKDRIIFYDDTVFFRSNSTTDENRWSYEYKKDIGGWHHYCFSRISGTIKFYVDSVAQSYISGHDDNNTHDFTIGWRLFTNSSATYGVYNYNGEVDEWAFKIGTGATQANVNDIYNSGLGADFTTVISSPDQYIKFNEATNYTGTTAADSSGNSNHMTLVGYQSGRTPFNEVVRYSSHSFGTYVQPDGVNDYATFASAIIMPYDEDWVVSFWFIGGGSSNTTNMATSNRVSNGNYIYIRKGSTPYVRMQSGANNTRQDFSSNTHGLGNWDDSRWHHLYMYRVGVDVHLVVDGIDYGAGSASADQTGYRVDDLFVRQVQDDFPSKLGMDDFIVHGTTGSVAQGQALHNSRRGANPSTVFGETPKWWYKFDIGGSVTTVSNSGSGGANNLTLYNFSGTYINTH